MFFFVSFNNYMYVHVIYSVSYIFVKGLPTLFPSILFVAVWVCLSVFPFGVWGWGLDVYQFYFRINE